MSGFLFSGQTIEPFMGPLFIKAELIKMSFVVVDWTPLWDHGTM